MQKNFFLKQACLIVFFALAVILFSCNNANDNPNANTAAASVIAPQDWISIDIKFKANTTGPSRDASIRVIEKVLTDTLDIMRNGKYSYYKPFFTVQKNPYQDTLKYFLSVGHGKYPDVSADSLPPNPSCTCANGCKICPRLKNYVSYPGTGPLDSSAWAAIDSIEIKD